MPPVTHFEIYGENPSGLAAFYKSVFGWEIERMPGIDYWRINQRSPDGKPLDGGLTYRAIPGLNGWMLYVNVESIDRTVADIQTSQGTIVRPKTAVPKTAWVAIAADPQGNMFGVWQADVTAFPMPEPE